MASRFLMVLLVVSFLENSRTTCGYDQRDLKSLNERKSNQLFHEMFQEMMRVSHQSKERSDEGDLRLRRVMGDDNLEVLKGGVSRRRVGGHPHSAAGKRRARSQALRRDKLHSQSLRSHLSHSRRVLDDSIEANS